MNKGGTTATIIANTTTIGVYTREKRVIKRSIFGFDAAAFSTASRIRITMESFNSCVTSKTMRPSTLMQPDITSVPTVALTGTGSPVTAAVSIRVVPSTTRPSNGIRSPGRISI